MKFLGNGSFTIKYVPRVTWRRGWHKLKTLVGTFTILSYVRNFLLIFFIKNCNSKCFIYIRNVSRTVNLLIRKKTIISKKMADVFSTCLCITIFKVMSASDEDHLQAFLFFKRTSGFPTTDATKTANGGALSPIQPL